MSVITHRKPTVVKAKKTVAKSVEVAPTKFALPSLSLTFGGKSEETAAPK